jgi:hypothetical protein
VPSQALVIPDGWAPSGWKFGETEKAAGYDMVRRTATVVDGGHKIASVMAVVLRDKAHTTLPAALKQMTDREVSGSGRLDSPVSVSPAVADTWAGHPALWADVIFTHSDGNVHQRVFMTQGPGDVVCSLMYLADEPNFPKYSAAVEQARNSVPSR